MEKIKKLGDRLWVWSVEPLHRELLLSLAAAAVYLAAWTWPRFFEGASAYLFIFCVLYALGCLLSMAMRRLGIKRPKILLSARELRALQTAEQAEVEEAVAAL